MCTCTSPEETGTNPSRSYHPTSLGAEASTVTSTVTDTATVSVGAGPTGTVTVRLFSDADCTAQVFTSTNALSGGTATSGSFTPAGAGTYFWTAVYNGDANNNTATSPCRARTSRSPSNAGQVNTAASKTGQCVAL